MEKFCQSCAMPLNESNLGTEKDGTNSDTFCSLCYLNGEYTNPNITYDEMLQKGIDGIEKSDSSKIKKWLLIKSYPSLLKKVKRWK